MFDLPNFAFSVPLAKFFLEGEGDHAESAEWLERALLLYPMMLKPLLAKCNVRLSEKYANTAHAPPHTPVCGLLMRDWGAPGTGLGRGRSWWATGTSRRPLPSRSATSSRSTSHGRTSCGRRPRSVHPRARGRPPVSPGEPLTRTARDCVCVVCVSCVRVMCVGPVLAQGRVQARADAGRCQ